MNLISANATSNAIFAEIPLSSSYIAMLVVLTKERTVKTVDEHCGSVLIPLSLCPIVLHVDLLISNLKKFHLKHQRYLFVNFII
jgi:hypothetical protein